MNFEVFWIILVSNFNTIIFIAIQNVSESAFHLTKEFGWSQWSSMGGYGLSQVWVWALPNSTGGVTLGISLTSPGPSSSLVNVNDGPHFLVMSWRCDHSHSPQGWTQTVKNTCCYPGVFEKKKWHGKTDSSCQRLNLKRSLCSIPAFLGGNQVTGTPPAMLNFKS
jgi:hypothetical protein